MKFFSFDVFNVDRSTRKARNLPQMELGSRAEYPLLAESSY